MKAGEDLDVRIAVEVFEHEVENHATWGLVVHLTPHGFVLLPKYSRDISAAWEVVEKLTRKRGAEFTMLSNCTEATVIFAVGKKLFESPTVPTTPHAVCLAALKAVGVSLDEEEG